jgi:hypothetical protein
MEADMRVLRQLIDTDMYVVDEHAVAGAILARAQLRTAVARPQLANEMEPRKAEVRSFRRDPRARSFRLARPHSPLAARR